MGANPVRFEPNVPQVIALAFSEGKEIESQFPKPDGSPSYQVLFTLVDGRRAFLPPVAAQKIKEAGITARVPFEICRRQSGQQTRWEINTQNGKAAGIPVPTAPTSSDVQVQPRLNPNTNHFEVPVRPVPQAPTPWPVHTPAQQAVIDRRYAEAEAHTAMVDQAVANRNLAAPAAPLSSMATRMLSAYVVAFDVIARLQEVSEQRGLGLNWLQEEHIRALATSAFIEENTERREAARRRS